MITKDNLLNHLAVYANEEASEYNEGYKQALHDLIDELEGK